MVLLLAPGLALIPLLPARLRDSLVAVLAALPTLGIALSIVALVSAAASLTIDGTTVRARGRARPDRLWRCPGPTSRQATRPCSRPSACSARWPPARCWRGAWSPARPCPATTGPSTCSTPTRSAARARCSSTTRSGCSACRSARTRACRRLRRLPGAWPASSAVVVVHGIWVFAVTTIRTVFAYARSFWGAAAGVVAAALWAVAADQQDILGWHGLPTVAALGAADAGAALRGAAARRRARARTAATGLGAPRHRARRHAPAVLLRRRPGLRCRRGASRWPRSRATGAGCSPASAAAAVGVVVLGGGVAVRPDRARAHVRRHAGYSAYLSSKLQLGRVRARPDLTRSRRLAVLALVVPGLHAAAAHAPGPAAALPARRDRRARLRLDRPPPARLPADGLLPARRAGRWSWRSCSPAQPSAARAAGARRRARGGGRRASPGPGRERAPLLRLHEPGVAARPRRASRATCGRNEVVVTDRCWSFLATWLLHTRTLPALDPADIQPKAELRGARRPRAILDGTPAGTGRWRGASACAS